MIETNDWIQQDSSLVKEKKLLVSSDQYRTFKAHR